MHGAPSLVTAVVLQQVHDDVGGEDRSQIQNFANNLSVILSETYTGTCHSCRSCHGRRPVACIYSKSTRLNVALPDLFYYNLHLVRKISHMIVVINLVESAIFRSATFFVIGCTGRCTV